LAFIAVASWITLSVRRESHKHECKQHLKQIMEAMHNYHDNYHCFPAAYSVDSDGQKLHSWRTLLLPYLGHADLYSQIRFDEPWNSPHNLPFSRRPVDVFTCPGFSLWSTPRTNYFAIVGRSTAWPEQYSVKISDIADGSSNTISLIEASEPNESWMEPHDLTRAAAIELVLSADPASRNHKSVTCVAMADGSVKRISPRIERKLIVALLSIRGGRPLPGVDWPSSDLDVESAEYSAAPGEPQQTDFWPTTEVQIVPDRNALYCATFSIAWDRARNDVGRAPIQFTTECPVADQLNEQTFPIGDLSRDAYIADAGEASVVIPRIRSEFARRFPKVQPLFLDTAEEARFIAYGYLQKRLPFQTSFDRLHKPLTFANSNVESFGLARVDGDDSRHDNLCDQVTIISHRSSDDFVMTLSPRGKLDEILLAKIEPQTTLRDTIAAVKERLIETPSGNARPRLEIGETLIVPVLQMSVIKSFKELVGKNFANRELSELRIYEALQQVRFQLDESGAILESEAAIIADDLGPMEPKHPRRFVFDKPFLLWLKESHATEPYFVAWIANDEFMVSFRPPSK